MITYGFELGLDLVFEHEFSVEMVLGSTVGSPLGYFNNMLFGLSLDNSFGTW